ncbi:MAG TPA: hypothetical protein VG895_05505 [Patescibacteria group bacterium]|nr:hypothetical protein [Patescibacteria group bacterium]
MLIIVAVLVIGGLIWAKNYFYYDMSEEFPPCGYTIIDGKRVWKCV